MSKEPYKCPVCGGTGKVLAGFYSPYGFSGTTSIPGGEICRTCNGVGVIWNEPRYVGGSSGWVCPVCGRGNSPSITTCQCKPCTINITCGDPEPMSTGKITC